MPISRTEQLVITLYENLRDMQTKIPTMQASAITDNAGEWIIMSIPATDGEEIPYMLTSFLSIAQQLSKIFRLGDLDSVNLCGVYGEMFIVEVGDEAMLTVLVQTNIELTRQQVRPFVARLRAILEAGKERFM
jgi:predicted regulator of Ras-like GTPase activity (Roadblock/LC7/MglB family)